MHEEVSTTAPCASKEPQDQHDSLPVRQPSSIRLQQASWWCGEQLKPIVESSWHHLHSGCTGPVCSQSRGAQSQSIPKPGSNRNSSWLVGRERHDFVTEWECQLPEQLAHVRVPRSNPGLQVYWHMWADWYATTCALTQSWCPNLVTSVSGPSHDNQWHSVFSLPTKQCDWGRHFLLAIQVETVLLPWILLIPSNSVLNTHHKC